MSVIIRSVSPSVSHVSRCNLPVPVGLGNTSRVPKEVKSGIGILETFLRSVLDQKEDGKVIQCRHNSLFLV